MKTLKLVPNELRWGSLGLGASQFVTVTQVTLPASLTSIATGVVLGIARAAGETAPLIAALFSPSGPMDSRPDCSMSVLIYNFAIMPLEFEQLGLGGFFVLVVMILLQSPCAGSRGSHLTSPSHYTPFPFSFELP